MQLLIQREQGRNILGKPIFKLWAKFDLTSEEHELMLKYNVSTSVLYEGNFRRDIIRALRWSIPLAFLLMVLISFRGGILLTILLGLFLFLVFTYVIYEQIREQITIGDMLTGRFFKCRSVVMLAGKEQLTNNLAVIFCRFLEAMKTWGGQEIITLDPYNLPEIHIIEFPSHAYT